ncbi:hypothetical protein D3C75_1285300 [compost metagenome]
MLSFSSNRYTSDLLKKLQLKKGILRRINFSRNWLMAEDVSALRLGRRLYTTSGRGTVLRTNLPASFKK